MKLIDCKDRIEEEKLKEVANCIKNNGLVVFPTETVYGIGANALDENAVAKIFDAKGRPNDNPLIVHICNEEMLKKLVTNVNEIEMLLMKHFWPGPMTIILEKKERLPNNVTCGLKTVGIRMPQNQIALDLIRLANVPIAAPSANLSGKPSGTTIDDIYEELKDKVDYMIDGGISTIGVESTVLKVVNHEVVILRPGKISPSDIRKLGLEVRLDEHIFDEVKEGDKVESPGMKHRHYAPNTQTILVDSKEEDFCYEKINKKMLEILEMKKNERIAIIGYDEFSSFYENKNVTYISLGSVENLNEVSSKIFQTLRHLDDLNLDVCMIQGVKKKGIGIAIMNRFIRACHHHVIKV